MQSSNRSNTSLLNPVQMARASGTLSGRSENGNLGQWTDSPCSQESVPDLRTELHRSHTDDTKRDYINSKRQHGIKEPHDELKPMDCLDLVVCHQDFPKLLTAYKKVKAIRKSQELRDYNGCSSGRSEDNVESAGISSDTMDDVNKVKERLCDKNQLITQGSHPMVDRMMDDNSSILDSELKDHESVVARVAPTKPKTSGAGDAIAVKYSKWQTDILMNWIIDHKADPFPDPQDASLAYRSEVWSIRSSVP